MKISKHLLFIVLISNLFTIHPSQDPTCYDHLIDGFKTYIAEPAKKLLYGKKYIPERKIGWYCVAKPYDGPYVYRCCNGPFSIELHYDVQDSLWATNKFVLFHGKEKIKTIDLITCAQKNVAIIEQESYDPQDYDDVFLEESEQIKNQILQDYEEPTDTIDYGEKFPIELGTIHGPFAKLKRASRVSSDRFLLTDTLDIEKDKLFWKQLKKLV